MPKVYIMLYERETGYTHLRIQDGSFSFSSFSQVVFYIDNYNANFFFRGGD